MGGRQLLWRSVLKYSTSATPAKMSSNPIYEGVLAINKPGGMTSAQVIREAQKQINPSKLFAPWLEREQAKKDAESHNQKAKRRKRHATATAVKMGHGGTLDPLATGVLILGVGSGTKALERFLHCTKSYEAVLLFGAATDTYDTEGKVVAKKPYEHITREKVEEAMAKFRGEIMQKPPIYSALKVNGKKLYEYARENKEVPVEIKARPSEVSELEIMDWMEGGTHEWRWPAEEADATEKAFALKVMGLKDDAEPSEGALKRPREEETTDENVESEEIPSAKKSKVDDEAAVPETAVAQETVATTETTAAAVETETKADSAAATVELEAAAPEEAPKEPRPLCLAPAARIRMTVTSGTYVRSLCHDLGIALGSLGLMAFLTRSRQADFSLDAGNVLPYEDLQEGEEKWGPQVKEMLEKWQSQEAQRANEPKSDAPKRETNHAIKAREQKAEQQGKKQQSKKHRAEQRTRRNSSSAEDN